MPFLPSPQQTALFNWVTNGSGNAFVVAVAGAGKTTSLVESMKLMVGGIALVAFGKPIAVELQARLKEVGLSNAEAGTFHSFGFRAWRKIAPKVQVTDSRDKNKLIFDNLGVPEDYRAFCSKAISFAKQRALGVFGQIRDTHEWSKIVDRFDLADELPDEATSGDVELSVEEAIDWSIKSLEASNRLCKEMIDFDDMIYAPVLFGARCWQYDWLLVDEAQDTNPARRALARKMVKKNGRVIFVGDPRQAIFGFTGADNDSVNLIIKEFQCKELPLTVTYRCPKAVVAAVQHIVKHIEAHPDAPEGVVEVIQTTDKLDITKLNPTDAILCRKTAPIVGLAFKLLRKGIACHVEGRDIGAGIKAMLLKWKTAKTVDTYLARLDKWFDRRLEVLKAKGKDYEIEALTDRIDTVRVLCEGHEKVADVIAKIDSMFYDTTDKDARKPNVTLSTVHKAKGREWNTVYIYGYKDYMPSPMAKQEWQKEQEANLIYVAMTRSKNRLVLVS